MVAKNVLTSKREIKSIQSFSKAFYTIAPSEAYYKVISMKFGSVNLLFCHIKLATGLKESERTLKCQFVLYDLVLNCFESAYRINGLPTSYFMTYIFGFTSVCQFQLVQKIRGKKLLSGDL